MLCLVRMDITTQKLEILLGWFSFVQDFLEKDHLEDDFLEEDLLEEDFLEEGVLRISSLITIFTGSSLPLDDNCLEEEEEAL